MSDQKIYEEMIQHAVQASNGSTAIMSAVTSALHPRSTAGFASDNFRDTLVAVIAGYGRPSDETLAHAKRALELHKAYWAPTLEAVGQASAKTKALLDSMSSADVSEAGPEDSSARGRQDAESNIAVEGLRAYYPHPRAG